jgi:hypothetical protein
MSACLLFWGEKIPDTMPTLPAKMLDGLTHVRELLPGKQHPAVWKSVELLVLVT